VSQFITDDELRARYGDEAELLIDALDRKVETQKFANFSRDREAVEAAIVQEELRRGNEAAKRSAEGRGYDLHPKLKPNL
jgi:hypothetical protein